MTTMPMRTDCKNYESRTYANGEVVRKCRLDLAPEAPWRCPDDCSASSAACSTPAGRSARCREGYGAPEPEPEGEDVAALLDAAEDIVELRRARHPQRVPEAEAPVRQAQEAQVGPWPTSTSSAPGSASSSPPTPTPRR